MIDEPLALVQQRVKIDRFTGGTYPGALFAVEPVFGANETRAHIRLQLDAAQKEQNTEADNDRQTSAEVGLLLLLLKDLWTGELPLGGERSVGRGRLLGETATIMIGPSQWTISGDHQGMLQIAGETADALESYVSAFIDFIPKGKEQSQ